MFLTANAAGNRLARQGQSELTGLLGPCNRSAIKMACPKCGCKVHYQYDSGWDDEQSDERLERCAACGEVFEIEDAADDDYDYPETQPGAPGFDGANAWNAFDGPEGCTRKASTRESGPFCLRPTQLTRKT